MRISDWSSDVCSSDLRDGRGSLAGRYHRQSEPWHAARRRHLVRTHRRHHHRPAELRPRNITPRRPGGPDQDQATPQGARRHRSEEHTSELQSLMRSSYAVFCLKKKKKNKDFIERLDSKKQYITY